MVKIVCGVGLSAQPMAKCFEEMGWIYIRCWIQKTLDEDLSKYEQNICPKLTMHIRVFLHNAYMHIAQRIIEGIN